MARFSLKSLLRNCTDGVHTVQIPRARGRVRESREANRRYFLARSPFTPEKAMQSLFLTAAFASPLHLGIWKQKYHERPKKHPFGPEVPQLVPRSSPQSFTPGSSGGWQLPLIHEPLGSPLCFLGHRHLLGSSQHSELLVCLHPRVHCLCPTKPTRWPTLKKSSKSPRE